MEVRTKFDRTRAKRSGLHAMLVAGLMAGVAMSPGTAAAQDEPTLTVMGLGVHMDNLRATGTAEGGVDSVAPFEAETGASVSFITGTTNSLQEALVRLGPLNRTIEDVIYLTDYEADERLAGFLAPLTPAVESGIPGYPEQWSAGALDALTFDDHLHALPMRCGTFIMWYNDLIFDEVGLSGAPTTPEELHEFARQATFTRPNGEQVFGFLPRGDKWSLPQDLTVLARMFGGDLITMDLEVVINEPPAVATIQMLQDMYREGILPPNWTSINGAAQIDLFRTGRASMSLGGANYAVQYGGEDSLVAGHAVPAHLPLVEELQTDEVPFSPSVIWYWAIGVLAGSENKDLAYDFISHIAAPDVQIEMARNGNSACTEEVLAWQAENDPAMRVAQEIFAVTRPTVPAHPNMVQIRDLIGEAVQDIVVSDLDVQASLDQLAQRIGRLLN